MRYIRWFPILGIMLLALTLAACGSQPVPKDDQAAATGNTVNVAIRNFRFELDRTQVSAGTVTFTVTNRDDTRHNFGLSGNGVERATSLLAPGQSETLTIDLKPGAYTYICTVPGHSSGGMRGTITVE